MIAISEDLLVKFLLDETTADENRLVNEWLAAGPDNKKRLAQLELIWTSSKNLASQSLINEDEAWKRFKTRVEQKNTENQSRVRPLWQTSYWRNIAATLLLVAGGWFFYSKILAPETTLVANNDVITETLPDGSEVTLNKNSSLSYSFPITARRRLIKLDKGEVFFKVSPDKKKPFIIQTQGVTVEVVGTSFNVNQLATTTEIIVETGIVKVKENKSTVTLYKGQKVVAGYGRLKVQPITDSLHNYYRSKHFTTNNTPLYRIVEVLNKACNAHIIIADPALGQQTLTSTFNTESLEQNLQIISETLNLKVERKGNIILLR